ncbi:MAG: hypothetical protein FJX67_16125 [Alphaproteobacteria bacterium]|nr:hypothetical protein [Alphaproteobacteria bacterium]
MVSRRATVLAAALVLGLLPAAGRAETACPPMPDPLALYGPEMRFAIVRNGTPVGSHTVQFERQGPAIVVRARSEIAVPFLFFTAYRFTYTSEDVWQDGCLRRLRADTDDNGRIARVEASADGDTLTIATHEGMTRERGVVFPTNHWHAGVLGRDRVLNTISGRVNRVRIEDRGEERIMVGGVERPARRHVYTGELETEVWYDAAGRWVKMRFAGRDGSTIEYSCERCGTDRPGRS